MKIFISYRREDTRHAAGRLAGELDAEFGREAVFLDVRSIRPGQPFADVIEKAGATSDVLIALIGDAWLAAVNAAGNRRLDDPEDFVRREIRAALEHDLHVVPVLVDGAAMPEAEELPEDIRELRARHWFELAHSRWGTDVRRLIEDLSSDYRESTTSLPVPATRFVGREDELEELVAMLERPDVRLLTVTGAPGTGKTRLALELGARMMQGASLQACFVDLSPTRDPAVATSMIAGALGVRDMGETPLLERVAEALRDRSLFLLILDNFEQVRSAAPQIATLLETAPQLKVVVTSRSALRVRGEHEYDLAPLGVGAGGDGAESPAVALFVDRAESVDARFRLTSDNAGAVAAICSQLDGLPLAIELAAARVKMIPPAKILARLGSRLDLSTRSVGVPERQLTVRATLEWSFGLLEPAEQTLLARLSVFSGGGTLDAIETVCGADPEEDVFDVLAALLDNSLVRRISALSGEPRFRMLETVREFAGEQLESSGEAEEIRRRHAQHFAAFAEERGREIRGEHQVIALEQLGDELDNLRAALAWLRDHDVNRGLEMAASLWLFWSSRGHVTEGAAELDRMLDATRGQRTESRAKALYVAGWLATMSHGDNEAARAAFDESATVAAAFGADATLACALGGLAQCAYIGGSEERAKQLWQQSLGIYRRIGDDWGVSWVLSTMLMMGDESAFAEALRISRRVGDRRREAGILGNAGYTALIRGDTARARELLEESMAVNQTVGDADGALVGEVNLGYVHLTGGDATHAVETFSSATIHAMEAGAHVQCLYCLIGLASIASGVGNNIRAATILGAVEALLPRGVELEPVERSVYEQTESAVKRELAVEELEAALGEGAQMTLGDAVAFTFEHVIQSSAAAKLAGMHGKETSVES